MLPSLTYPPNFAGPVRRVQELRVQGARNAGRFLVRLCKRSVLLHRELATRPGAPGTRPCETLAASAPPPPAPPPWTSPSPAWHLAAVARRPHRRPLEHPGQCPRRRRPRRPTIPRCRLRPAVEGGVSLVGPFVVSPCLGLPLTAVVAMGLHLEVTVVAAVAAGRTPPPQEGPAGRSPSSPPSPPRPVRQPGGVPWPVRLMPRPRMPCATLSAPPPPRTVWAEPVNGLLGRPAADAGPTPSLADADATPHAARRHPTAADADAKDLGGGTLPDADAERCLPDADAKFFRPRAARLRRRRGGEEEEGKGGRERGQGRGGRARPDADADADADVLTAMCLPLPARRRPARSRSRPIRWDGRARRVRVGVGTHARGVADGRPVALAGGRGRGDPAKTAGSPSAGPASRRRGATRPHPRAPQRPLGSQGNPSGRLGMRRANVRRPQKAVRAPAHA